MLPLEVPPSPTYAMLTTFSFFNFEALAKYIKEQNDKHKKKLWGGIVVPKNDSFRYNNKKKYQFNETNLGEDWDFLNFK